MIAVQLAERLDDQGQTVPLIAETGGINAMIVDSSALPEQVIADALASAFDSAGQRCSALRLLCLQQESADHVLTMLHGALRELKTGSGDQLSSDIGPIIDQQSKDALQQYVATMQAQGHKVTQYPLDESCEHGSFMAPTLIELDSIKDLNKEVFGPVLHVLRYRRQDLDQMIDAINAMGYGLTFGVHSRIDETIQRVLSKIQAGNIYVNRNIVGAVVGVQPFGGSRLSGTGPKAGGPLYMSRLLSVRPAGLPVSVSPDGQALPIESVLPGPTGERNVYRLQAGNQVLCIASSNLGVSRQWAAVSATGNHAVWLDCPAVREWLNQTSPEPTRYTHKKHCWQGRIMSWTCSYASSPSARTLLLPAVMPH
jgi:RHH-type proline utilization regulon transcriptional repressor/proline dehydrogenase/delta 1-pyrroline-5-carboxylate dehydrogenase